MITKNDQASTIATAVNILQAGGLVAFPTETVYGLGGDARNRQAVHKIYAVKERPYHHSLIVHIATIATLTEWATEIPNVAWQLAEAFWPGPLTLVLKRKPGVLDIVTAGQETIGIRIPRHPLALALLTEFGGGIAAPSANKFTRISPTTAQDVRDELGAGVEMVLEGGPCQVGLESTILDINTLHTEPTILRPGMISAQQIEAVIQMPVHINASTASRVRAPGMHHLHYAPRTHTVLLSAAELVDYMQSYSEAAESACLLHSLGLQQALAGYPHLHVQPMSNNPITYAHDLYHMLRLLDNRQFKTIFIEDVPQTDAWIAIRDRLMKASSRLTRSAR